MKKKTYRLWVPYHTGITVEVEAKDLDEAVEKAKEEAENGAKDYNQQLLENLQRDGAIDELE